MNKIAIEEYMEWKCIGYFAMHACVWDMYLGIGDRVRDSTR